MRKKLFLLSAAFLMAAVTNAQVTFTDEENNEEESLEGIVPDKRKSAVSFGFKVGANMSSMTKYDVADLGLKSGVGFEGGVVIAARFGKHTKGSDAGTGMFGVQVEPTYALHNIGTSSDDIKLNCIEVPILLKIFLTPNFNVEVGPNICGSISSKPDNLDTGNMSLAIGDLKAFDIKASIGVSYETKGGLFASLRYNLGTSELAKNFPCKVSAANLTLGYKFNIFKF
jgi:hypothetical protein